ncbi:DNA double-strand break repair protein isoform X1 [Wolffia australiana]
MDFERWTANSSSEREPEYLLEDCRCVLSDILEEEAVFEKKRRCLTGSTMESRIFPKSAKVVESLINSYIPESYIRNDDDSLENMRLLIKNTTVNPFPERSKELDISENDSEKVITEEPPDSPTTSQGDNNAATMDLLSEILIKASKSDPNPTLITSYISELLSLLEDFPSQALIAMDKKLKNKVASPLFAATYPCKRIVLINRLRKQCKKIILDCKCLSELPASLSKTLSIICLLVKAKKRKSKISTRIFFPFSGEVQRLQNEILDAIWAIPELKPKTWKLLDDIFCPKFDFPPRYFRKSFYNYLMEYLFFCDDLRLPEPLWEALKIINRRIQPQLSANQSEEELENVLHISCQLREIIWECLPNKDVDQEYERYTESLGLKDASTIEILDMDCSLFGIHDFTKIPVFDPVPDGVEGSGDSMPDEPAVRTIDLEKNSCDLRPETTNWYQGLVNISDDASMVAYKVINLLLEKLMREEGSSRPEGIALADLLWAVGEITPSFPKSVIEKFENSLRSSS